jgi:hypothetical protein
MATQLRVECEDPRMKKIEEVVLTPLKILI